MSISVKCVECGKSLKAPDSSAGKKAKCPQCGAVVEIPEQEQIYDAEDAIEDVHEDDFEAEDVDYSNSPDDTRRPCPVCGEMILVNAAKCRFCHEVFDSKLKKKKKKKRGQSTRDDLDDDMTVGDWIVAIVCSGIGCIAGIVWMIQGKSKGLKMIGVSIVADLFKSAVVLILQAIAH